MSRNLAQAFCPHCGGVLDGATPARLHLAKASEPARFDLDALARIAAEDKTHDETVKVRVTQEDIRNLLAKRKRARK